MVTISAINTLIVAAAVPVRHRFSVLIALARSLLAHVIEVWIFAIGFFALLTLDGFGALTGNFDGSLLDCVYFSFTTYTTLGIGDIEPRGDIRFLVGLEGLTGFLLITWSASFMFMEMARNWRR